MNPWQHRLLWLSVIALFAGVPFSKAVSSIGIGLLGISAIILVIQRGFPKTGHRYKPLLGLGTFFLFYLISCIYSSSFLTGMDEAFRQNAFISLPLFFWVASDWLLPRLRTLIAIFTAACTVHCLITIGLFILPEAIVADMVSQIAVLQPYPELSDRLKFGLYTPFLERLNLAYLIGFAILYLIYDGIYHDRHSYNWIQGAILISTFLLIGARGAQIAFLGAIVMGALSYLLDYLKTLELPKHEYRQKLTSVITIVLIGTIATPFLIYNSIPAVQKRYDQLQWELRLIENGDYLKEEYQYFSTLTRIRAFTNAVDVIIDHPIIGSGIGEYDNEMKKANEKYNDKVPVHNQNFFLYIWGASGILALLAFLHGIWYYLKSFWNTDKGSIRHLALAYIIFICLSCMIDAFLKYHIGSISVMLFLSTLFLLNIRYRLDVA